MTQRPFPVRQHAFLCSFPFLFIKSMIKGKSQHNSGEDMLILSREGSAGYPTCTNRIQESAGFRRCRTGKCRTYIWQKGVYQHGSTLLDTGFNTVVSTPRKKYKHLAKMALRSLGKVMVYTNWSRSDSISMVDCGWRIKRLREVGPWEWISYVRV